MISGYSIVRLEPPAGIPLVVVGISLGVFHDQYGGPAR
jgi:hypothetical protein